VSNLGKLYDLHSGRRIDNIEHDYARNDETVDKVGKYVGKLPKHETDTVREMVDQVARKKVQLDALIADFNESYNEYAFMIAGVLAVLEVDEESFDPTRTDAYVDKEGHVWLVDAEDRATFYAQIGENPLV
jgi:hypothetical protein